MHACMGEKKNLWKAHARKGIIKWHDFPTRVPVQAENDYFLVQIEQVNQ